MRRMSSKVGVVGDAYATLPEDSAEAVNVLTETSSMTTKLKREALIAGMTVVTQGVCQDVVYFILNFISAGIVAFQFFVNLQSLFLNKDCSRSGSYKAADIWFYAQLVMNGTVTIVQFGTWIYAGFKSCCFLRRNRKCPTSRFATMDSGTGNGLFESYQSMRIRQLCEKGDEDDSEDDGMGMSYDDMDHEEQHQAWIRYEETIKGNFAEHKNDFQSDMKSMATSSMIQNWLTTSRAIIGALGAIVDPALTAAAAFGGAPAAKVKAITAAGTAASLASATAKNKVLEGLEQCVGWRSTSTAGSAIIATIGLKQAQMRQAYTKLVMLSQIRATKKRTCSGPEMERYDKALEDEIMEACGPEGKKMVSFLSGKPAE